MSHAALPPLPAELVRSLAVAAHPRGQPHLSAASGLVCAHGRVYVVADDEQHLAVFDDVQQPGALHRLDAGGLPRAPAARKRRKRDFEALFLLHQGRGAQALVALGSGSLAPRCRAVVVALDASGVPQPRAQVWDMAPLLQPLRARLGAVNIEGAFVQGDAFVLLNRGADDNAGNLALHYRRAALRDAVAGVRSAVAPQMVRPFALGRLDGVELGFTDAAALPGGGWLYSAAAEARAGSVADGPCPGSVVGCVDAEGRQGAQRRLAQPLKVEGLAVRRRGGGLDLCLVTDADDAQQPSLLLRARW